MKRSIRYLLAAAVIALLLCFAAQAESAVKLECLSDHVTGVKMQFRVTAPANATNCKVYYANEGVYREWYYRNVNLVDGVGTFEELYGNEYTLQIKAAAVIDGETVESDELILEIASQGDPGVEVHVSGPAAVTAGQDYTISWNEIPGATLYRVYAGGVGGYRHFDAEEGTSYTIPWDVLAAYPKACIGVDVYCRGYNLIWDELTVDIPYTYSTDVTLTAPAEVYQGQSFSLCISAAGAEQIQYAIFQGPSGSRYGDENTFDMILNYDPGTYSIYARGMYNGQWGPYCAPASMQIKFSELLSPGLVCPEQLTVGQPLTISYEDASHISNISVTLYGTDGQWLSNYHFDVADVDGAGTVELPEQMFIDPGNYSATISFETESGYRADSMEQRIVATGSREAGPEVTALQNTVNVGDTITFYISDPDATLCQYKVWTEDLDGNMWLSYSPQTRELRGGTMNLGYTAEQGDTVYYMKASVLRNGKWSAYTKSTGVRVNSAKGTLDNPVVSLTTPIMAGAYPQVTFGEVENAQRYCVSIEPMTGDGDNVYRVFDAPGTYTLDCILDAGSYQAYLWVEADGWNSGDSVRRTLTVTGELADGPVLASSAETATIQQQVVITAELENAEQFVISRTAYNADGSRYSRFQDVTVNATEGRAQYSFSIPSSFAGKTVRVLARAKANGVWTKLSAPLNIYVEDAEAVQMPSFSMPTTITVDEDLNITFGGVDGADHYRVSINEQDNFFYSYHLEEPGQITIPAGMLDAGSYSVRLYVQMQDGRSGDMTRPLSITGTQAAGPQVTAPATGVARQDIPLSVSAPGAEQIAYEIKTTWTTEGGYDSNSCDQGTANVTNGVAEFSFAPWRETECTVYVRAKALVNGAWTAYGEISRIDVSSLQVLDAPTLRMADSTDLATPVTISFDAVDNAEYYELEVRDPYNHNVLWQSFQKPEEYTLPLDVLDQGLYTINLYARAEGWGSGQTTRYLTVTVKRPDAPAVSMEQRDTYYVNEGIQFTVDTTGADAMEFRLMEYYDAESIEVTGDSTQYTFTPRWTINNAGLQFRVRKDGMWSAWSASKNLNIVARQLPQPVVTVPATIEAGQDLTVSFTQVEGSVWNYEVTVIRPDGTQNSWYLSSENTLTVPEDFFDPGDYTVQVRAMANSGWEDSVSDPAYVTVTGSRVVRPSVSYDRDRTYYVGDSIVYTFIASGAEKLEYTVNGDTSEDIELPLTNGEATVTLYFADMSTYFDVSARCMRNGEWSLWSDAEWVSPSPRSTSTPRVEAAESEITAGQSVHLTLTRASGEVVRYEVNVTNQTTNTYVGAKIFNTDQDTITVEVDGSLFRKPGSYRIDVVAFGDYEAGWGSSSSVAKSVTVNPSPYGDSQCGPSAYWTLSDNGILTISGVGKMFSYYGDQVPWNASAVRRVVVESGITHVGGCAFMNSPNLVSVQLPEGLQRIGSNAFSNCVSLKSILVPSSVTRFGSNPFDYGTVVFCYADSTAKTWAESRGLKVFTLDENVLTLPADTRTIESEAFAGLGGSLIVEIPDSVTSIAADAFDGSDVAFRCNSGSAAASFAQAHDIPVVPD